MLYVSGREQGELPHGMPVLVAPSESHIAENRGSIHQTLAKSAQAVTRDTCSATESIGCEACTCSERNGEMRVVQGAQADVRAKLDPIGADLDIGNICGIQKL